MLAMDSFLLIDHIVIIDDDPIHAAELRASLASATRIISLVSTIDEISGEQPLNIQIVILVTRSSWTWKQDLGQVRSVTCKCEERPIILCLLRWLSHGPAERLFGDRVNAKVIHEK